MSSRAHVFSVRRALPQIKKPVVEKLEIARVRTARAVPVGMGRQMDGVERSIHLRLDFLDEQHEPGVDVRVTGCLGMGGLEGA